MLPRSPAQHSRLCLCCAASCKIYLLFVQHSTTLDVDTTFSGSLMKRHSCELQDHLLTAEAIYDLGVHLYCLTRFGVVGCAARVFLSFAHWNLQARR